MIRSGMTLQLKLRRLFLLGIDADQVLVYNLNRKRGCCAQMISVIQIKRRIPLERSTQKRFDKAVLVNIKMGTVNSFTRICS